MLDTQIENVPDTVNGAVTVHSTAILVLITDHDFKRQRSKGAAILLKSLHLCLDSDGQQRAGKIDAGETGVSAQSWMRRRTM